MTSLNPLAIPELLLNVTEDSLTNDFFLFRKEYVTDVFVKWVLCALYACLFAVGFSGNILVCYVVANNSAMHTVTNLFITNLALSDILLCFLAVPFTPIYTFAGEWIFGNVMCHLVPYAQAVSVYVSTWTLTAIAADRYFVIIYSLRPRMMLTTCMLVIAAIWIFALAISSPYCWYMVQKKFKDKYFCEEYLPSDEFRLTFGIATSVLQYVIPFIVIAFCYIRVVNKLNDRAEKKAAMKSSTRQMMDRERTRRTNKMLIAMVVIFGICWLPLNAINLINDYTTAASLWTYYYLCFFVAHILAMSSICYNPLLYAWLNENFRKEFKVVLPCFRHHRENSPATWGKRNGSYKMVNVIDTNNASVNPNSSLTNSTKQTDVSHANEITTVIEPHSVDV